MTSLALRSVVRANLNKNIRAAQCAVIPNRGIAGKVMRDRTIEKPKPFPYEKHEFKGLYALWDKCTHRFDENSKLIVVDGAHAVGKTKFAKELAEELEMHYLPEVSMDEWYINVYGEDVRELSEHFMPRVKPYDEKDYARNPMGPVPGSADRMLTRLYTLKYRQHLNALRHIMNTGQGVVMEKSCFSWFTIIEAAFNAGYISRETRRTYYELTNNTLRALLRPNLVIYLDAPVDVVQKNIKARGNEWDKNSPLWNNGQYLQDIYTGMMKRYLKEAKVNSQVMVYDWSEPGETEVVVEDIEQLNFDYYGIHDEQQKDWRHYNEHEATNLRLEYSSAEQYNVNMSKACTVRNFDSEHLFYSAEERINLENVCRHMKGHVFEEGFNPHFGDNVLFKCNDYEVLWKSCNMIVSERLWSPLDSLWELKSGKPTNA